MSQDQLPSPESPDQEPQPLPENQSGSIPEVQQPEVPTEIASGVSSTTSEQLPLEELEVRSQELEEDTGTRGDGDAELESRKSGVGGQQPAVSRQPASEKVQEVWNQVRPVLQVQTVKALKGTIQLLEGIVEKLEDQELEKSGAPGSGKRSEIMPPTSELAPNKLVPPFLTDEWQEKFRSVWKRLQQWWATVLPQIRERLPESLNQKFSDRAITGAIVAVFILFLWIVPGLFSSKPKPTPVAKTPPTQIVTSPPTQPPVPPQISTPEPAKPIPTKPAEEKPAPKPVVRNSPAPSPLPSPPPPPLKLTPEQKLIARIQDQVAEISNQYVNGLIQSVQANFRSSLLTVRVGDGWYGLSQPQQNKLANEVLQRTQQLDFSKLEITDTEGALLARSPVVGSEMIILKRETEASKGSEKVLSFKF
ncbi:hypothetical protein K9N68_16185 [Kovacikia minuta CCNUW1]|uniref:APA family fibronectin-binding glycoprotein n=1 Tax=Kovacikia minuta TaxID=2931930 RepID=UPI001CCF3137|nr:APA family fibronectin-binding glycoprotein [Kovacikia minuta]UBF29230.1 hypothetical protein K9N68_16185 [Kovacikia minuta CCNUW1]